MEKTKIQTIGISRTDKKTGKVFVKQYATVDSRVEFFREKYPDWTIETDFSVLDYGKGQCICRATIKNANGVIVSTGTAYEWTSKPGSIVNGTSFIENCETSAVGRALGFLGIGINGCGIASAEEVQSAQTHQENNDPAPVVVDDTIPETFITPATHPDDWLTENAFAGMCQRATTIDELTRLVNSQKGNPRLKTLVQYATTRKQELLEILQAQGE